MITYSDILQKMRDVLANNQELQDWCQVNYGKQPTIFVGIDERNPPGKKNCPLIILRLDDSEIGKETKQHEYKILVDWAVLDESVTKNDNIIEYRGVYQADAMGQIIWRALPDFSQNISLSRTAYALEPIDYFPMILGGMDLSIIIPNLIGGEINL